MFPNFFVQYYTFKSIFPPKKDFQKKLGQKHQDPEPVVSDPVKNRQDPQHYGSCTKLSGRAKIL
jgi:hypothetical protein